LFKTKSPIKPKRLDSQERKGEISDPWDQEEEKDLTRDLPWHGASWKKKKSSALQSWGSAVSIQSCTKSNKAFLL